MSAAFTGADGRPQIPGRGTAPRYPARGERSVLNGKPVVADGKGNWLDGSKPMTPMSERSAVGNYNPGLRFPSVEQIKKGVYSTNPQNPAAPAQPAVDSNGSNGARGENRSGVEPVNGSFRTAVEQGPDGKVTPSSGNAGGAQSTNPQGSGYIAPTGGGSKDQRVNANGLLAYGRDLSSLNQFTSAFTGGYEIADIKSAFQSNDLQGAYQNGSNKISTEDTKYTLPDGSTPSNVGGKYTMDGVDTSIQNTGYKIDGGSVPGTVGGNANDPQDGTSSKPDVAESIRAVRMERQAGRGSRRDPRNRGGDADMFGGPEPSDASLVSPMYANAKRNKIRSTFLDHEGSSVQAIAAANAVAHYGKDSNADARFNVGGKLVYAKDGMQQKAKNAAMMGQDPSQFLDIPATVDTQPDTPAASELSPAPASTVKPGTIQMPENNGGSIESPEPILKVDPAKQKEAENFMSSHMSMLTRKTK